MKLKRSSAGSQSSALPGTLLPLLLALAGIAAAAALIWTALFGPSNQRYERDMAQAYAQQQAGALNSAMAQLEADLQAAAANPQVQVTLKQDDSLPLGKVLRPLADFIRVDSCRARDTGVRRVPVPIGSDIQNRDISLIEPWLPTKAATR